MSIRHMVVISDLHIGSTVALCPDEFTRDDGVIIRPSPMQHWLRLHWKTFWDINVKKIVKRDPFITVINGETVEGDHHNTHQIVTRNISEQRQMSKELLMPLRRKSKRLYVVRGTAAHSGHQACDDETVARLIDADGIGIEQRLDGDKSRKSEWQLRLQWGKYQCLFRHHTTGGRSWAGKLTAVSKELTNELVNAGAWESSRADLMFFSHIHDPKGGWFPTARGRMTATVCPAWQAPTEFAQKIGHFHSLVGGYVCSWDDSGYIIRDFIWRTPENATIPIVKLSTSTSSRSCKNSPKSKRKTAKAGSRRGK